LDAPGYLMRDAAPGRRRLLRSSGRLGLA
jgi:hypothetical protein